MTKVKLFMGAATPDGVKFLENSINEWIDSEKVDVKQLSLTFGIKGPGGLGVETTNELFVSLLYEKP